MKDTIISFISNTPHDTIYCQIQMTGEDSGLLNSDIFTNGITILLALIAGFIALYQAKSNIIASSRIRWIETLRENISDYCVAVEETRLKINEMQFDVDKVNTPKEVEATLKNHYQGYKQAASKSLKVGLQIKLLLNDKEKIHKEIRGLIDAIDAELYKSKMKEIDEDSINTCRNEIISKSMIIFETEWKKSKKIRKI